LSYCVITNQLTMSYGKKQAIKNLSIKINENQLIGLIGRNGSGKTTLLKLCAGLLQPNIGEIEVFSQNPVNNLTVLQDVIYSYINVPHKSNLTLGQIIEDFHTFYPHFDSDFAYRLLEAFSFKRHFKYRSLSQGMTSVFNFICAIATRAKLTLLDEPVLGMDITVRNKVYEILLRDYMEHPRTIIISSHILSELEDILSEFLIIDSGELVLYQPQEDIHNMAYRVDGSKEAIVTFLEGRPVLYEEHKVTGSYAIIEEPFNEAAEIDSKKLNLSVSKVGPEDLYIYKTTHGKELNLDCLWEEQN